MDRMALNGAIETLISGKEEDWQSAAQMVIDFGVTIPSAGHRMVRRHRIKGPRQSTKTEAFAAGVGNVELKDPGKKEVLEYTSGAIERVGHYRLIHFADTRSICIEHYLKSGPFAREPTEGGDGGYRLIYSEGYQPDRFFKAVIRETVPPWKLRMEIAARTLWPQLQHWSKLWWYRLQGYSPEARFKITTYRYEYQLIHSVRPGES
jgi:hypothetical protein